MSTEAVSQSNKDRVYIFDTTLRDGEQSPGATMTLEEKLQIAEILDDMASISSRRAFPLPRTATSRRSARSPSDRKTR